MEWEKIFVNDILDKGLVSKIYKELTKLNMDERPKRKTGSHQNPGKQATTSLTMAAATSYLICL